MAAKIFLAFVVSLCMVQCLTANTLLRRDVFDLGSILNNSMTTYKGLFSPLVNEVHQLEQRVQALFGPFNNRTQSFLRNVTAVFQKFKQRIAAIIAAGSGIITCVTGEKNNVTTLITQGENEVLSCGKDIIAQAQPLVAHLVNTTQEVMGLIVQVAPKIINCFTKNANNPVLLVVCFTTDVLPMSSTISQIISDIKAEVKDVQQTMSVVQPKLQECQKQLTSTAFQVGAIVKEVEQCVADKVKQGAPSK